MEHGKDIRFDDGHDARPVYLCWEDGFVFIAGDAFGQPDTETLIAVTFGQLQKIVDHLRSKGVVS